MHTPIDSSPYQDIDDAEPERSEKPSPFPRFISSFFPRILVVDDEQPLRSLFRCWLEKKGFSVWTVANGHEAIQFYRDRYQQLGAVLLDVEMPGFSGVHTLKAMRTIITDVPICLMTGNPACQDSDLDCHGFSYLFLKPFCIQEVANILFFLIKKPGTICEAYGEVTRH